jgi:hypothetical protein
VTETATGVAGEERREAGTAAAMMVTLTSMAAMMAMPMPTAGMRPTATTMMTPTLMATMMAKPTPIAAMIVTMMGTVTATTPTTRAMLQMKATMTMTGASTTTAAKTPRPYCKASKTISAHQAHAVITT